MSILAKLGSVSQLKELLTDENLEYLDQVLTILLTPVHPAYNAVWLRFQEFHPNDRHNMNFTKATNALVRLHTFIKQSKKGNA